MTKKPVKCRNCETTFNAFNSTSNTIIHLCRAAGKIIVKPWSEVENQ